MDSQSLFFAELGLSLPCSLCKKFSFSLSPSHLGLSLDCSLQEVTRFLSEVLLLDGVLESEAAIWVDEAVRAKVFILVKIFFDHILYFLPRLFLPYPTEVP